MKFQLCITLFASLLVSACGSNSDSPLLNFVDGYRLRIASEEVTLGDSSRRLGYVINRSTGTIAVIDVRGRVILDTDDFNSEDTPLSLGGELTDIFEWKPQDLANNSLYRVGVVDGQNQRLFIFDVREVTEGDGRTVEHELLDLGDNEVGISSLPVFLDRGRRSNPSIRVISTSAKGKALENWEVRSTGNGEWVVEGSESGEQSRRARSGTQYSTDGDEVTFIIIDNDLEATGGDRFFFGTRRAKPLPLDGSMEAVLLIGSNLYLCDRQDQEVEVLNLETLTVDRRIPLDDGSGNVAIPSGIATNGDVVVVSNLGNGNSVFVFDVDATAAQTILVPDRTSRVYLQAGSQEALLIPRTTNQILRLNVADNTLSTPAIDMAVQPLAAAFLPEDFGTKAELIVTTDGATADLVNLDNLKRIDTRDNGDPESFSGRVLFVDTDGDSNPTIVDVITVDGKTRSEEWIITYEGTVDGASSSDGMVDGNELTDVTIDFSTLAIRVGDTVVLEPFRDGKREEVLVESISTNTIGLSAAPQSQGTRIRYEIRPTAAYTLYGSISGFQVNRIREGGSGSSDGGEITLSINPAGITKPTSRGDYFSFTTNDGVTPIFLDGEFPVDVRVFEGRAYIINKHSNNISIVNIGNLDLQSGIN